MRALATKATKLDRCPIHGDYESHCHVLLGREIWTQCPECLETERAKQRVADQQAFEVEALARRLDRSELPPKFRSRTLDSYAARLPRQREALTLAQRYVSAFPEARKSGRCLILSGNPGTGKTHLAAGIALALMQQGRAVRYATVRDVIQRVYSSYRQEQRSSEQEALAHYTRPDLLVLDEVGQHPLSENAQSVVFNLINARYNNNLPLVAISNLTLPHMRDSLGLPAYDRLREGGGTAMRFDWDSYRGCV